MHKFFSMYLFLFISLYTFRGRHAHHQERQIVSEAVLIKFVSPDDEHEVLETCREL